MSMGGNDTHKNGLVKIFKAKTNAKRRQKEKLIQNNKYII